MIRSPVPGGTGRSDGLAPPDGRGRPDPGRGLWNDGGVSDQRSSLVRRWLAAGDDGDLDSFDDLLDPEVVVHAPRGLSTTSCDDEKAVWRKALDAIPDLRHDVREVVVDGDVEMARVVVTGTMRRDFGGVEATGRSFRIDQAVIAHLRDGRIVEAWEIADLSALEAPRRPA